MYNHTYIIYYEDLATPPTECPIVAQSNLRDGYNNRQGGDALELEWTAAQRHTNGWNLLAHMVLVHEIYVRTSYGSLDNIIAEHA
jgi:hypothetical protein